VAVFDEPSDAERKDEQRHYERGCYADEYQSDDDVQQPFYYCSDHFFGFLTGVIPSMLCISFASSAGVPKNARMGFFTPHANMPRFLGVFRLRFLGLSFGFGKIHVGGGEGVKPVNGGVDGYVGGGEGVKPVNGGVDGYVGGEERGLSQ
jgi:hypothetical protein